MAVGLSIKFDDKALRKALEEAPKLAKRSAVFAINRTAQQAQTASIRRLSAATRIPVRKLRERTSLRRASFRFQGRGGCGARKRLHYQPAKPRPA